MTAEQRKKKTRWCLYIILGVFLISFITIMSLLLFAFDVVTMSSQAMSPTLQSMDNLISNKTAYKSHDPQRYDIILLEEFPEHIVIKRIIGMPYEHIAIIDKQVFINGSQLHEEYLNGAYTDGDISMIIPEGHYFVMGDNRSASHDSRAENFGLVAKENIHGKVIFRFSPLKRLGFL